MLFADQRHHSLRLPVKDKGGQPANIAFLIRHLCQNVMDDTRKELFVLDDHLYVNLQSCVSSPCGLSKHAPLSVVRSHFPLATLPSAK